MKVLVTGATGIVGTNLVRALLEASHQVRVLVRPSSDVRSLAKLPVERREGDILDLASLNAAARGCSVIFHAAAVFSYWGMSAEDQRDLAERGTRNVLEAARKNRVQRDVVTSSCVLLGSTARGQVLDETSAPDEPDPSAYTRSKMAQEVAAFGGALGVGALFVTHNPVGLAVQAGVQGYGEYSGSAKIQGRAKQAAKEIADQLQIRFKEEGWIK